MELAADTLAEVGTRDVAIQDAYGARLQSVDGELVVTAIAPQAWSPQQAWAAQLAPTGCTGDCAAPRIRLDAWEGFGVLRHADGSVEVAGDVEAAGRALVCRQGNSLRRWSACREAFSSR